MPAESVPSNPDRSAFLKPFWTRVVGPPWAVSLLLAIVLGAMGDTRSDFVSEARQR